MNIIATFYNIPPISSVENSIKLGGVNNCSSFITDKTVILPKVFGNKEVSIVSFVWGQDYNKFLADHGLKFCRNSPNYLLGILTKIPFDDIPSELLGIHIGATDPYDPGCVFVGVGGKPCLLYMHHTRVCRSLGLVPVRDEEWIDKRAFLAEPIGLVRSKKSFVPNDVSLVLSGRDMRGL